MIAPSSSRGRVLTVALFLVALAGCGAGAPTGGAPAESLPTVLTHADGSFRDGDYAEAQSAYEQALRIDPEQSRATANLATCYLKNRIVKKAETLLQGFLERHPDDAGARLVLARVYLRQGELGPAADSLREVLRTHPDVVTAHYNLGLIAYRSRLYDEAETHLMRAVALKPDLPDAHYTLGLTYLALNRSTEAIASLKQAEREQAVYADLSGRSKSRQEQDAQIKSSSVKAIQYMLDKKYAEALAEYQELTKRHPDYAPIYSQIGQLQISLGRPDEAFQALRRAVEIDPKLSDPHYLLSGLYRERGDQQSADRELETFAALE